ncbi:MAG: alkaline phosphatase [Candidatus Binatia bacterium]|nr:alkaline phosphatase [Candidatus Binatia bacterium]
MWTAMQASSAILVGIAVVLLNSWGRPCTAAGPQTPEEWFATGRQAVEKLKALPRIDRQAKNVILFVGDGMGISTVTAARILDGQLRGESGEENLLSFETFPHLALAKTYSTNQQTPDSAPTMSAMVTGIKTGDRLLSVTQRVVRGDYRTVAGNLASTILELAEQRGLATGVVTTTRITHATPAACYAHTADRDWEADADLPADARAANFPDLARQLLEFSYGNGLEVALGGGRGKFLPNTLDDPEEPGKKGERLDGRDLTAEWLAKPRSAYVWNKAQFDAVDPTRIDHLLGLFDYSHMEYETDRGSDAAGEPSLSEMTAKAIDILARQGKGFFLHVEGGRIDHAHHAGNAYRALTETIEFARAVQVAMEKTSPEDTLIIVTADHSHVFTIAGYPKRGNPILGKVIEPGATDFSRDLLGLPYTTLGYANGPGYIGSSDSQPSGVKWYPHLPRAATGALGRPDLSAVNTAAPSYLPEATVPLAQETHGGEDVAIYARGPQAHLFQGVMEQHVIFHVMATALGFDRP